jgi:hypothetical protein
MNSLKLGTVAHAESDRNLAVNLGGTCVAILVFVLFFLYSGVVSFGFDRTIFQATLLTIIFATFLFASAGTYYFVLMALLATGSPKATQINRRAYLLFSGGIILLALEPVLIMFTVRLYLVAWVTLALWVAFLALLAHSAQIWRELS